MEWLTHIWERPDEGIWEVRGGLRVFLFSRLMCWGAFDCAGRLARKRSLPAPLVDWLETRDAIYQEIHAKFWDSQQGAFVQSKGSTALDASCLLMPLVRFVSPTDPRWLSTLKAIGDRLLDDSLVYRYSSDAGIDGLRGGEGTFNICTFWYVECLARAGDVKQARFLFEKMLGYANHVGSFQRSSVLLVNTLATFRKPSPISLSSARHITWIERCPVRRATVEPSMTGSSAAPTLQKKGPKCCA